MAAEREPDPVDLMMAGDFAGAIAKYRAILAEVGDDQYMADVCTAQIAYCEAQLKARAPAAEPAPETAGEVSTIVTCTCGQKNRVPALAAGKVAICAACKSFLQTEPEPEDDGFEDDEFDEDEDDDL